MAQQIALTKSRMRWAGRSYDSIDEILDIVLNLFKQGHTSPSELARIGLKDRRQINRYLNLLAEQGRLTKDTQSGRILKSADVAAKEEYVELEKDSWVNSYPLVRKWADSMATRKGGKPITAMREYINNLKRVCDTLKVTPNAFATDRDSIEELMRNFSIEFGKTSTARIKNYVMSVRDFAITNGVVFPRGVSGILSGKKHNFGVYANIFLTDGQFSEGLKVGESKSKEVALYFGLGHETFARPTTLRGIRSDQVRFSQFNGYEYATMSVYESKTAKPFEKLVIDPRVLRLLHEVMRQHGGKLFTEGNSDQENYFAGRMREIYGTLGIDVKSDGENGLLNYYRDKPLYILRHSGAHLWHRRGAKVEEISGMGWDDPSTLVKCYMRTGVHEMFQRGTCMQCNPPKSQTDSLLFCGLPHAMQWLNERFGGAV